MKNPFSVKTSSTSPGFSSNDLTNSNSHNVVKNLFFQSYQLDPRQESKQQQPQPQNRLKVVIPPLRNDLNSGGGLIAPPLGDLDEDTDLLPSSAYSNHHSRRGDPNGGEHNTRELHNTVNTREGFNSRISRFEPQQKNHHRGGDRGVSLAPRVALNNFRSKSNDNAIPSKKVETPHEHFLSQSNKYKSIDKPGQDSRNECGDIHRSSPSPSTNIPMTKPSR